MASPYLRFYICVSASSVVQSICIERLAAYALGNMMNSTNLPAVTREPSNNNETTYVQQNAKIIILENKSQHNTPHKPHRQFE